jgi:hypothetical protein
MHELTSFSPMPAGSCIFGDVEAGTGGIVLGADTRATEGPIVADKVRRPGSDQPRLAASRTPADHVAVFLADSRTARRSVRA